MARLIKEAPVLKGKDAHEFMAKITSPSAPDRNVPPQTIRCQHNNFPNIY